VVGVHTERMECALFYPYVVPPSSWVKQSLLYYDVIGSVVHNRFMDDPPNDIAWLIDAGHYETVHADQLGRDAAVALVDEFIDVLAEFEQSGRGWLPDGAPLELVNYGKLPDLVENQLVDLGVLRGSAAGYLLQPRLLGPLICLLAKYAAVSFSVPSRHYSMHTTMTEAQDVCLSPLSAGSQAVQNVLAATLQSVLPVPGEQVPFDDILEFKDSHRRELLQLRANAEAVIASLLTRGEDVNRAVTLLLEQIELERLELSNEMRRAGWRGGFATAVVTVAAVAGAHLAPGATPWVLSGVGSSLYTTAVVPIRNRPAPRFSYLHQAEVTFK